MKRCPRPGAVWTLLEGIFDRPRLQQEIKKLEEKSADPGFWDNPSEANKLHKKLSRLRDILRPFEELNRTERELAELYTLLKEESEPELEKETDALATKFLKDLDAYELETLLSEDQDASNALVEINAGAGGSEACDWASMLFRMYSRWAASRGFKLEILSETPGDVTGYRSINFALNGHNAYGYAKTEHGVHRLVRISPFDANAKRHTSFAKVEVLPETDESEVEINPDDLKVETLRAGGAGGQHVNKTESAVRITHIPSGIVVQCQNERSQHKNRDFAMKVLLARLAKVQQTESEDKIKQIRGQTGPAEWGRQIRSYVMQPYTMVKDHRTGYETGNVTGVMDGDLNGFIEAYLKRPKVTEDAFYE